MRALLTVLVAVAAGACARPDESSPTEPQPVTEPAATKATGPVIAMIATNNKRVAIVGGGEERRVIVRDNEGTILADGLTLAELRAYDPLLGLVVGDAVASNGGGGTYVDATLSLPERIHAD